MKYSKLSLVAPFGLALAFTSASASAATRTWGGGNLFWNNTSASGWNAAAPVAADTAIINSGTVTFFANDTYGNAAITSSAAVTINTGGTVASGGKFNTLWNLTLGGGTLSSNGGVNASYGTYNLAGTVTAAGGVTSSISTGSGSFNLINLGNGNTSALTNTTFDVGAAGTLNVGTVLQDHRYETTSTQISAAGLIKTGVGTMTLSNVNTYTGATTVNAGKLTVSAGNINSTSAVSIGAGNFNYNSATALTKSVSFSGTGGTLSGTGTITPSVTISAGNTLAKGNSIGTQAYLGNLTLAGNDQIELGNSTGAGTYASPFNSDLGNVSGNLTLGGTLSVIDNAGADSNGSISAGSYKIYTYGGTTSGSYSGITNATGYRADIVNNGAGIGSGQGIYLDNYRVASAATTQTVTLNTRTGVAVSTSLSLTNANNSTAPYQENLGTTGFSGTTSGFTATGSATGIAGGGTGSGTLSVGVNAGTVGTAGTYSGSTTLGLQTEEVNSSGLGNAGVGNQAVTINVTAYDFASADFTKTAGDGSLTGGGLSYTLDFGTGLALNTNYTATLQLANGMFSAYKDSLQGTYGTVGGAFSETAGNFASLISGGTDTFTVSFFTGTQGTFTDTLTFDGTSLNTPLGNSALSQINIGIAATAIPEPGAALLGSLGLLALLRRRRN